MASDAHFDTMVGNVAPIMALLDELEFPQQLIVNLRQETFGSLSAGAGSPHRRQMREPSNPLTNSSKRDTIKQNNNRLLKIIKIDFIEG